MKRNHTLLILLFLCFSSVAFGQISVTPNPNGNQLAQIVSGPGVIISNINLNCPDGAAGSFTCNNCSLGMDSGIVLTNGLATNVIGPNNAGNTSYAWGLTPGDQDLANSINQPASSLWDNCALEFDLTVQGDSMQFKYIFGSEEYPEFVCSSFNDAFAFFISGPGIAGLKNIALIPGTNIPVAINSVNPGVIGTDAFGGTCTGANQSLAYSQYYVNNGDGTQAPYNTNPYYIQYDGFTTTLTASIGGLTACQTYHLKLVVDDVGDDSYDSGVFIQANSLSSNQVTVDTGSSQIDVDSAVRRCRDGVFTLRFLHPVSQATTVNYTTGGTAVNGIDYSALSGSVQFAAGDSTQQIVIHAIGNSTQTQTLTLYLTNQCSNIPYDSATIYIITPQQIVTTGDTTVCPGDTAQLLATGGAAGTAYAWAPNSNFAGLSTVSNPMVYPTVTTTYTCSATFNGCTSADSVVVTVYNIPPFGIIPVSDILSCGFGAIQLNAVVNGNPVSPANPFKYTWAPATGLSNPFIANPVYTPAPSNSTTAYTVNVASALCVSSTTFTVTVDSVTETMSSTITTCSYSATGTAAVTPVTGNQPYSYVWTTGATTATAVNLTGGLYGVQVTDNSGCTSRDTVTVYAPAAITFNAPVVTDVSCPGGSNGAAAIAATGGTGNITYAWSSGSTTNTAMNLTAATYVVTATDANACTATTTVAVGTLPSVTVNIAVTGVSCFGGNDGTATAVPAGGTSPYTYLWDTGATANGITALTTGNYPVTVTDNSGCTVSASGNVTQPPLLTSIEGTTNVSCFGDNSGSIIISPTGGTTPYSYNWNDGSTLQNRINIPAGIYMVTITDAKGCNTFDTAVITQPNAALTFTDSIVNATCFGLANGAVYLTVSGGTPPYSYSWGIGIASQNATNILAGNYYPSVTDNLGCLITNVATVTSPSAIVFADSVVTDVTCFGKSDGTATVNAYGGVGGYTYTWNGVSGPDPDNSLAAGTYNVIVTDTNNCTASQTVVVAQPTMLTITITGQNALCYEGADGQAVDFAAGGTPPYTYLWSDNQTSKTATLIPAGLYESTVTDDMGCTTSGNVVIGQPAQIMYSVDSTPVKCVGAQNGTITVNVTSGGVPPYNYAATKDLSDYNYTTDSVVQGLDTGYYTVLISDNNGCTLLDTVYVPNAVPDSFMIATDSTSCFGPQYTDGAIHVKGLVGQNSPFQYKTDNSPLQFSGDFYNLAAGNHSIQIVNYNGCVTDTSATIGQPVQGITEVLPHDTTMQLGETIQLFSSFSNYPASSIVSYNWVPSVGLSCVDCPDPVVNSYSHINNYWLTVTYNKGCLSTDSATVIVIGTPQVFIPNSFTPNGDGNNDFFMIYGENIKTVGLKIFDRWGEEVFDSENQFLGWDGTYKGKAQPMGVYVYEAQITFLDNTQTLRTGSITLIR